MRRFRGQKICRAIGWQNPAMRIPLAKTSVLTPRHPTRLFAWGPALIGFLGLFWLSSISKFPKAIPSFAFDDKVAHILAYGTLAILFFRGLELQPPRGLKISKPLLTLLVCVLYGASDEIHQLFVHGRCCEFLDWVADAIGACGALYFFAGLQWPWRKKVANAAR